MCIDKDNWLLELICGKWRFVDHDNKLLTCGWFEEDQVDIEKVSLKDYMIEEYKINYIDYIL